MMRQRGFTLLEVLFAAAAAAVVIGAASAFLLKGLGWYDELNAKVEINRHARETYELLAYGGRSTSTGNDGTKYVYSLRGRNALPSGGLRNSTDALQYTSNNLTLTPDQFSTMSVPCTGSGTPIPDCTSAGNHQSVTGWMGQAMTLNGGATGVNNLTVTVTFYITNPFEAQRAKSPGLFTERYRAIFTLNRRENDP